MEQYKDRRAVVTGAAHGIGKEVAIALAERGYHLILIARQSERELEELASSLKKEFGICCDSYCIDVGDYEQVEALFSKTGEVDLLVNNAGIAHIGLLSDMTKEEWRHMMATNLDAIFFTSKQVIPGMVKKQAGQIINVSSVWGNVGASMEVAYSATKGGVNSFTKALAKELAPSHIRVNAVAFGAIDTRMNDCLTSEDKEQLIQEIPADRMGTAKEAAQMILQVIDAPEYLTGQVITMDGGWI